MNAPLIYDSNTIFFTASSFSVLDSETGTNDIKKVFQTIKIIEKSNYNFKNIKKIIFFPSERIDIVLQNKKKIRFPINLTIDNLNLSLKLIEDEVFHASKIIDLRIPNKVISYD